MKNTKTKIAFLESDYHVFLSSVKKTKTFFQEPFHD